MAEAARKVIDVISHCRDQGIDKLLIDTTN